MPVSNSSINLVDLDFDNLRNSFKNYLRTQDQFKDYDFDGSNFAVLLDLLAYNTTKNAFYTNMAISEGFLDSAQLRNSLYSHAKELNYVPRSKRSAKARVKVSFTASSENQPYVIQKGSQLSTLIKSESYVFSIPETLTVSSPNQSFEFTTDIYEGIYLKDSYIFVGSSTTQRFKITNKTVDTGSIAVTVFEDGNEVGETYKLSNTLLDLSYKSKVFFIQVGETGYYEIYFGDGVLGYQPKENAVIVIDYRTSKGPLGNGARKFSVDFDPTNRNELLSTPTLEVIEPANNGADEETNESIRYYAPRHFQVQERTVKDTDYEIALKSQFPEINAVSVFGGEEAVPPQMGKVFVVVDIAGVEGLPESKKTEYYNFIERRSPFGIRPIFVEPEFTYIQVKSKVRYNVSVTTNSINRIKTLVTNEVMNYNDVYLNDFNTVLRNSQFVTTIDKSDPSIISNITDIRIYKKLRNPSTGRGTNYEINFGMPLDEKASYQYPHIETDVHVIQSSSFMFNGTTSEIHDDGKGGLYITKTNESGLHEIIKQVGTVDYHNGILRLDAFQPQSYFGTSIKFYAYPADKDISTTKNNIITIESDEVLLDIEGIQG